MAKVYKPITRLLKVLLNTALPICLPIARDRWPIPKYIINKLVFRESLPIPIARYNEECNIENCFKKFWLMFKKKKKTQTMLNIIYF